MRYAIFEINPRKSYGITVGSRVKPDSEFREQVVSQIDKAMESLERNESQTHRIVLVPDLDTAESGLSELPELTPRSQYLIFALLYSKPDSAESLSNAELEFYRKEIEVMLEGILGKTRAALVLLQDCNVNLLETDGSLQSDWEISKINTDFEYKSPWR